MAPVERPDDDDEGDGDGDGEGEGDGDGEGVGVKPDVVPHVWPQLEPMQLAAWLALSVPALIVPLLVIVIDSRHVGAGQPCCAMMVAFLTVDDAHAGSRQCGSLAAISRPSWVLSSVR